MSTETLRIAASLPWPAAPVWRDRRTLAWVLLLCIGQVVLWGLGIGLNYQSPEIDSAEQFVWAFSMENGYWKHPPLPSWIMHVLLQVFGPSVALPFVAAQACIVIALALTWRLGCEFMSARRALIAMALTSLVAYHNVGADSFNHNTVLLPFQAATLLLFYLATRRGAWHLWALTGLFAGLAMLVKYVALVPLAGMALYFLVDRSLHHRRAVAGLLLATAMAALVLTPHALWLQATHFMPFRYARSVTEELPGVWAALNSLAGFLLLQLVRVLPFLAGLWFVLARRAADFPPAVPQLPQLPALAPRDRLFLWVAALSPLGLTALIGLVGETALQGRWGTNAFLLSGLLALGLWRRPDTPLMWRRTVQVVVVVQVLMCAGQTISKTVIADRFERPTRANFPGALLARLSQETWKAYADAPLRLVVSDIWLGGNLIANSPQRLAVLIDGHHLQSPWVKAQAVDTCGALILDDTTEDHAGRAQPNPALDALLARADASGTWVLPWARPKFRADGPDRGVIRWAIIKPQPGAICALR